MACRTQNVEFKFSQRAELLMELRDRLRIRQRIAGAVAATLNREFKRWPEDDVVERQGQVFEGLKEPGADNAVDNDEIAAAGISFGCPGDDIHDDFVLPVRFRQVGRDPAVFDEVPEIVRMQVHLGCAWLTRQSPCRCRFPRTWRAGQDENFAGEVDHDFPIPHETYLRHGRGRETATMANLIRRCMSGGCHPLEQVFVTEHQPNIVDLEIRFESAGKAEVDIAQPPRSLAVIALA